MSDLYTFTATCPRCGRLRGVRNSELCDEPGDWACNIATAAYRRGIAAGLALAKEHAFASVGYQHGYPTAHIEWHEVDAATATEK